MKAFGWREATLVTSLALLAGCSDQRGVAAPNGKAYYTNGGENNAELVKHEQCHLDRINREGGVNFWGRYLTSNQFRCEEEKRCGADIHPLCFK